MSVDYCPRCKRNLAGQDYCASCGRKDETREPEVVVMTGVAELSQPDNEREPPVQSEVIPNTTEVRPNDAPLAGTSEPRNLRPVSTESPTTGSASEQVQTNDSSNYADAFLTPATKGTSAGRDSSIPPTAAKDAGVPSSRKKLSNVQRVALKDRLKGQFKGDKNVMAHDYTLIQHTNHYYASEVHREAEPNVPLVEITTVLPPRELSIPGSSSYHSRRQVERLKEQHLLFIGCVDEGVAFGAAYSLLDELGIEGEERRLLNFDRNSLEKSNLSMQFFNQRTVDDYQRLTAIVVDAVNPQARTFLGWLITRTQIGATDIRHQLKANGFLMVCLVDAAYMDSKMSDGKGSKHFPVWKVPFLRPLLAHYYPEEANSLEVEILQQQKLGKWELDDAEFSLEIRRHLEAEDLREIVAARKLTPERPKDFREVPRFKGNAPIEDTVLYVATYFPALAPHEFDQLVEWLLGEQSTTVKMKTLRLNEDKTNEVVEIEVEKRLRDFWSSDPDKYFEACKLESVPGPDYGVVIDFSDARHREDLKAYLAKRHSIYLMRQYRTVQSRALFESAPRIVTNAMRLSVEMAIAYPDSFGKEWLFRNIVETKSSIENDSPDAAAFSPTSGPGTGSHERLKRLTQLLRQMWDEPQLEETVDALLKDLMAAHLHQPVLAILKALQFAPGFNEFQWMKRLLDEGDEQVRRRTYYHLYSYIKKIGIYAVIKRLEAWLPTDERSPDAFPSSTNVALRLLVEFCSEATETFDSSIGRELLKEHPLLIFEDEASAVENLNRLMTWFFHPGMQAIFDDLERALGSSYDSSLIAFMCEMVLEWMFFLQRQSTQLMSNSVNIATVERRDKISTTQEPSPYRTVDEVSLRRILVECLAKVATRPQQNEMLAYWEQLRDFMAIVAELKEDVSDWISLPNPQERKAILSKRELVRVLLREFREAIRNDRLSTSPTQPLASLRTTARG